MMTEMRLLKISNLNLLGGLNYLSSELRVMEWHGYPLKSMPASFQSDKLIELRMHCSHIKLLWKGIKVIFSLMQMCILLLIKFINA
jgi:hypothetical protein